MYNSCINFIPFTSLDKDSKVPVRTLRTQHYLIIVGSLLDLMHVFRRVLGTRRVQVRTLRTLRYHTVESIGYTHRYLCI